MPQDVHNTTVIDEDAQRTAESMVDQARQVGENPPAERPAHGLETLMNVGLTLRVELGHCRMKVHDIVNLGSGSVVELEKLASEPVDILVNDVLFARGDVVVVEDHFAVKITELVEAADAQS